MNTLAIGGTLDSVWFIIKDRKEFPWGIIGTLTNQVVGDVSFKFSNGELKGDTSLSVVRVTGSVEEYNGAPQVRGVCMFQNEVPDSVMAKLAPTTTADVQAMWGAFENAVQAFTDADLRQLTESIMDEFKDKYIKLPGGKVMHHAYIGGLLEHSYGIFTAAMHMAECYKRLNKDVLCAGAILHDIGKVYEFDTNDVGLVSQYSMLGNSLGHAAIGVGIVMAKARELCINVAKPSVGALLNVIGTHAGERDWGAVADNTCAEAVIISGLDKMDARLNSIYKVLDEASALVGEPVSCKAMHGVVYRVW